MRNHRKYIPSSIPSYLGYSILIALCALAPELWSSDARAQQLRPRNRAPVAFAPSSPQATSPVQPTTGRNSSLRNSWAQQGRTRNSNRTPVALGPSSPQTTSLVQPVTNPNSALGSTLASCDKESDRSEPFSLPGGRGEVRLDRCYKGRAQHICSNNALLKEARLLLQEYGGIIEARYPDIGNVGGVCAINPDALSTHVQSAAEFTNRFKSLTGEYAARSNCAARVTQSMRDVVLPDLAQAPEMIKSMIESIEGDSKDLSVVQAQVVEVAGKIDASQKAMVTIGKIHQTMCFKDQRADTVSDAQK
jgi:hypothetical protein